MSQISQNSDGTYARSYSDTELMLIRSLQNESDTRLNADQQLKLLLDAIDNRVTDIEDTQVNLADLQRSIFLNTQSIDEHESRIQVLEASGLGGSITMTELMSYLQHWKIEEILYPASVLPSNDIFNNTDMNKINVGYVHFEKANIKEPFGFQFRENSMRRYTINAYAAVPKTVSFKVFYAKKCVVYIDQDESGKRVFSAANGNFTGTAEVFAVPLKAGWTKIQFLVANETQAGGLVVESDLFDKADFLSCLEPTSGMVGSDQIQSESLEARHFSPNIDLTVHSVKATKSSKIDPGVIIGDPTGCASLQIADGLISKCMDEPFIIHGSLQIEGDLYLNDGTKITKDSIRGLTDEEREKLASIEWYAEVNQNAYSFVKAMNLPASSNLMTAADKKDTLHIRGRLGIELDIQTNADGKEELWIENSPTVFKEEKFVSSIGQTRFTITTGEFQLGRNCIELFIEGLRQPNGSFIEIDETTIELKQPLDSDLDILIVWQEGSPQFAKETIVSVSNIPIATETNDGLMSKWHVYDLYHHRHEVTDIDNLRVFNGIQIHDGTNIHRIDAENVWTNDVKFMAGSNIVLEKINDWLRISSNGPTVESGNTGIGVTGSPETGYIVKNLHEFNTERGLELEVIDNVITFKGPDLREGGGMDIQILDDHTYKFTNIMDLDSDGGLVISGNAWDGYTVTNAMSLTSELGIRVTGDAVTGYQLTNTMTLNSPYGIRVAGNAEMGYEITNLFQSTNVDGIAYSIGGDGWITIQNDMNLDSGNTGIQITGDPKTGYTVHNKFDITAGKWIDVVGVTGEQFEINNAMIVTQGGGIIVEETTNGFKVTNDLLIQGDASLADGPVAVTGTATGGYTIHGHWPSITAGDGIAVDDHGSGSYTVKNMGVLSVSHLTGHVMAVLDINVEDPGYYITAEHDGNGHWWLINDGVVELVAPDTFIEVGERAGSSNKGIWEIYNKGVHRVWAADGIKIDNTDPHNPRIENDGVISIQEGDYIKIEGGSDPTPIIHNDGVWRVTVGDGLKISSDDHTPHLELNLTPSCGIGISATASGAGELYRFVTLDIQAAMATPIEYPGSPAYRDESCYIKIAPLDTGGIYGKSGNTHTIPFVKYPCLDTFICVMQIGNAKAWLEYGTPSSALTGTEVTNNDPAADYRVRYTPVVVRINEWKDFIPEGQETEDSYSWGHHGGSSTVTPTNQNPWEGYTFGDAVQVTYSDVKDPSKEGSNTVDNLPWNNYNEYMNAHDEGDEESLVGGRYWGSINGGLAGDKGAIYTMAVDISSLPCFQISQLQMRIQHADSAGITIDDKVRWDGGLRILRAYTLKRNSLWETKFAVFTGGESTVEETLDTTESWNDGSAPLTEGTVGGGVVPNVPIGMLSLNNEEPIMLTQKSAILLDDDRKLLLQAQKFEEKIYTGNDRKSEYMPDLLSENEHQALLPVANPGHEDYLKQLEVDASNYVWDDDLQEFIEKPIEEGEKDIIQVSLNVNDQFGTWGKIKKKDLAVIQRSIQIGIVEGYLTEEDGAMIYLPIEWEEKLRSGTRYWYDREARKVCEMEKIEITLSKDWIENDGVDFATCKIKTRRSMDIIVEHRLENGKSYEQIFYLQPNVYGFIRLDLSTDTPGKIFVNGLGKDRYTETKVLEVR